MPRTNERTTHSKSREREGGKTIKVGPFGEHIAENPAKWNPFENPNQEHPAKWATPNPISFHPSALP